jgi:type II secretory pathway pseudopilin PulG
MVVMAIIAILATAGLSAYTGYIKKARDAVRIADINAINNIVIGSTSVTGAPPQTSVGLYTILRDMNNGIAIADPLSS